MIRLLPLALLVALVIPGATASARPVPCEITIPHAPDDVRAEIETWVRAEQRCATSLEVRVVPTEGGFYLFARDGRGFTRQRIVPDARTAAALVASWMADDSIDGVWLSEPANPLTIEQLTARSARPPGMQPGPAMPALTQPDATPGRSLRRTGLAVGVAGLIAIGAGAYYGIKANQVRDQILAHPGGEPWPANIAELEQQGESFERRQLLLMSGGGVLVVGGAALYLVGVSRGRSERVQITPTASANNVGVSFSGSF